MEFNPFDTQREALALYAHQNLPAGRRILMPASIPDPEEKAVKRKRVVCKTRGCNNKIEVTHTLGKRIFCQQCENQ